MAMPARPTPQPKPRPPFQCADAGADAAAVTRATVARAKIELRIMGSLLVSCFDVFSHHALSVGRAISQVHDRVKKFPRKFQKEFRPDFGRGEADSRPLRSPLQLDPLSPEPSWA